MKQVDTVWFRIVILTLQSNQDEHLESTFLYKNMEPFELSLKQVNFEEHDIAKDDELHAFSNIVSYDSDFQDPNSEGVPVRAGKVKPASKSFCFTLRVL